MKRVASRCIERTGRHELNVLEVQEAGQISHGCDQAGVMAMSTMKIAPMSFATLAKRSKSMRSEYAEAPAMRSLGRCSRA